MATSTGSCDVGVEDRLNDITDIVNQYIGSLGTGEQALENSANINRVTAPGSSLSTVIPENVGSLASVVPVLVTPTANYNFGTFEATFGEFQSYDDPPEFDVDSTLYDPVFPPRVSALTATPPDTISVSDVSIPDPFTYVLPPPPEYTTIAIPDIVRPDFTGLINDINALYSERPRVTDVDIERYIAPLRNHANNFQTSLQSYTNQMVNTFENRIVATNLFQTEDSFIDIMDEIANGTRDLGLPASVEDQMFASARSRADAELLMAQQEAMTDMAARGFSLPSGVLIARLDFATQQALLKKKDLNRDLVILHFQEKIKEFWNAVSTVSTLSNARFSLYANLTAQGINAAQAATEAHVAVATAYAALINARIAAYNAAIAVINERVRVELSRLEADKIILESLQLKNQINETQIRVYLARLQAIQTEADIYRTQVEGARVEIEIQAQRVINYRAQVEAYGELVRAKEAEYRGFAAEVEAEATKVNMYESRVRAFGERIRAYASETDAKIRQDQTVLEKTRISLEAFRARLESSVQSITLAIQNERNKIEAFSAAVGLAGADMSAQASFAGARASYSNALANLAQADASLKSALASATVRAGEANQNARVEVQRTIYSSYGQIASAALAALDIAASISQQCSESINLNL